MRENISKTRNKRNTSVFFIDSEKEIYKLKCHIQKTRKRFNKYEMNYYEICYIVKFKKKKVYYELTTEKQKSAFYISF